MRRVAVPLTLTPETARPRGGRPVRLSGPTMGVSWTLQALAPAALSDAAIGGAVQAAVNLVVAQMSSWEPDSDLSRFNRAPAGAWVEVPEALMTVVRAGLEMAEQSAGAFDPTVGHLVDLWGFGAAGAVAAPPDAGCLGAVAAGWRALEVDPQGRRLRQPGGLALDLSGIAKGYGVDLVAGTLERLGLRDFLIEIGGELRGSGVRGDGEPWFVEIEPHPGEPKDEEPILVALHGLSIASSGDWRRSFISDRRRYSHTLDPRTHAPVQNGVAAVTVIHPQCMRADALCTALIVQGEAGPDFARRHEVAARFIFDDGMREVLTPAFEALLA